MIEHRFLDLPPIDPAAPGTLGDLLRDLADRYGETEAVVCHDALLGGERISWSFTELHNRAMSVASALAGSGLARDERVGILMGNRPEFLASFFGIAMAGGVAVPLSTFSTPSELAVLLAQSGVSVLLAQRHIARRSFTDDLAKILPGLSAGRASEPGFPFLKRVVVLGGADDARFEDWERFLARGIPMDEAALAARQSGLSGSDRALVIFTSGTTSRPKGVLHVHSTVVAQSRWQARLYGRYPGVRVGSPFPLFWSAGLVSVACSTLAAGGTYVADEVFEPGQTLRLIASEAINEWYGFPTHTAALAEHPDWPDADLRSLTRVRGAYEFDGHPHTSPDPQWHHVVAYGMSESCTFLTSHFASTPPEVQRRSAGLPLPGVELRIVAQDSGEVQPAGVEGEICARGSVMMPHYLGMARSDCFDADGFFHSGDLGYIDEDGYLHWTGRAKTMIKTGGANVAPAEIEAAAAALGTLKLCRAIGVPDRRLGEMIVLCAVREDGSAVDEDNVRSALRQTLASFKVPRRVLFFAIEDYPLTASGKVRDGDLAELASARLAAQTAEDEA